MPALSPKWKSASPLFKKSWLYSVGFYAVWVGYLGKRFGLFSNLVSMRQRWIEPRILASRLGLYAKAVEAWCSAAISLGFLLEKDGCVRIHPEAKEIFVESEGPCFLGGHYAYLVLRSQEYMAFEGLFLSGRRLIPNSPNTIRAFAEVTSWDHYAFLESLHDTKYTKLKTMLLRGADILDVGCGSGGFMERVSRAFPKSRFLGIDPFADEIKRSRNTKSIASNRNIKIMKGNGESMSFRDQFDVVYMGESLYLMSNKSKAISNCFRALRKGGMICIIEGLLTDSELSNVTNEQKMIMSMQLDFILQGHEFMKRRQIDVLLHNAGFKKKRFYHLGMSFFLVTAEKM